MIKNNAAILLFSRTAIAEAEVKPLATSVRVAESVAAFLVNRTKQVAAKTQLPVFFLSEQQQRGTTFGERFANAFEDVFAMGFERVIAIGNDCLTLSSADILKANKLLQSTPSVLGATNDGGVYLIGLDKTVFKKHDFINIHWQSHSTFSELIAFIENQNYSTFFLSEKTDLDNITDWQKTLQTVSRYIKIQLLQLFSLGFKSLTQYFSTPINDHFLRSSKNLRAPPFCISL